MMSSGGSFSVRGTEVPKKSTVVRLGCAALGTDALVCRIFCTAGRTFPSIQRRGRFSGISSGGSSSDENYVFAGTISYGLTAVNISGSLNKLPPLVGNNNIRYLIGLGMGIGGLCTGRHLISGTGPYSLTVDF